MSHSKKAAALFPFQTSALDYKPGDHVKKLNRTNESQVVGVVTHILPKSGKLRVQWPYGNEQESPEELYKVSPEFFPANVGYDTSYDSHEHRESESVYGNSLPKRPKNNAKLAAKIAAKHVQATAAIIQEIETLKESKLSSVEAYMQMSKKFAQNVGDSLLKELVSAVYEE